MSIERPPLGRSAIAMDTLVTFRVATPVSEELFGEAADRALVWFNQVERICSRFDPASEVLQLTEKAGCAVSVSPLLFQAVNFALAVAEMTGGAFDPTVGYALEARGFNRHYLTGAAVNTPSAGAQQPTYRDVVCDEARRTITLVRPLVLDLGAVVKGLAIDLAARELASFRNFSIDAGGDVYVGGRNTNGDAWRIGIRHPRDPQALFAVLNVQDAAVCTSGDYERRAADGSHHILDPRHGGAPIELASVTVIAPNAMLADAISTAAFVLGVEQGLDLLERQGLEGLFVTPTLDHYQTAGMGAYLQ